MLYSYDKTTDQLVPAGDLGGGGLVGLKSTRTTTGDWTITGLTVGKPLYLLFSYDNYKSYASVMGITGVSNAYQRGIIGYYSDLLRGNSLIYIPSSSTVVFTVDGITNGASIQCYQ